MTPKVQRAGIVLLLEVISIACGPDHRERVGSEQTPTTLRCVVRYKSCCSPRLNSQGDVTLSCRWVPVYGRRPAQGDLVHWRDYQFRKGEEPQETPIDWYPGMPGVEIKDWYSWENVVSTETGSCQE